MAWGHYIHQAEGWPHFTWDEAALAPLLADLHFRRGSLLASMAVLGFEQQQQRLVSTLVQEVTRSGQIEGESLDPLQVRSSLARRLGLDTAGLPEPARTVEGMVDLMLDATQQAEQPVTEARLFGWQASLFPVGYSGIHQIAVGKWRTGEHGPMQVVSGAMGRERVHFEAPETARVHSEMQHFLRWLEDGPAMDPLLKAGLAHFWFVTIHPFEDGNGRIARALTELLLTRADHSAYRYYSLSRQIEADRKSYYEVLEQTQSSQSMDVSPWLHWFLQKLDLALREAEMEQGAVYLRQNYWQQHPRDGLGARQLKVLELLLSGEFQGKLRTGKYASLTKVSTATAQRDLQELVAGGYLIAVGAGRSTAYELSDEPSASS